MHIMVIPSWYSSKSNKVHGSFFKEQFKALQNYGEKISVAYNEVWPITKLVKINEKRKIKAYVSMFGRETLVEFQLNQVQNAVE